jgi:hypothetical protein
VQVISREEFAHVYSELFSNATPERIESLFKYLDKDNCGVVDYLSWHRAIRLQVCPLLLAEFFGGPSSKVFSFPWPRQVHHWCWDEFGSWQRARASMAYGADRVVE